MRTLLIQYVITPEISLARLVALKYVIPNKRAAPDPFFGSVAVAINDTIYTFGGISAGSGRNELWTLSRTETGGFTCSIIEHQCRQESPSPRYGHTGWKFVEIYGYLKVQDLHHRAI